MHCESFGKADILQRVADKVGVRLHKYAENAGGHVEL